MTDPVKAISDQSVSGKNTMFFPDFDSEWDDDLPTVLQVLEGIEVEDMPDIHVEREPTIYTPTRSEIPGPNRLMGLTLMLEAETTAAEMQPADRESRVVEYKPLRVYNTIPPDAIESSIPSLPGSDIGYTPRRGEVVDEDAPDQFSAEMAMGDVEVRVGSGSISAPAGTPIGAGPITSTDKEINTKLLKKAFENHQEVAEQQEGARTGSVDKIPEVADSADTVQDGIAQSARTYDAI